MPATKLPTTSYALLGLLSIHEMSGYELAQAADRSIANFWPISRSQVYGELGRLEQLGFVGGTDVEQERLPDKRVFELSEAGRAALTDWLSSPDFEPDRLRLGFCVKLFFGHHMPRDAVVAMLQEFRASVARRGEYLASIVEMLSSMPTAAYVRATAQLGQRIAETSRAWADEMLESLPEIPHPEDEAEHNLLHEKARKLFEKVPPRATAP